MIALPLFFLTYSTAAARLMRPYPTSQNGAALPFAFFTGWAVSCSADRSWLGDSDGFAWSRTAAAPAACGEAMLVPEAVVFSPGGHGPTAVPAVSHVDEMPSPGAVTSGW